MTFVGIDPGKSGAIALLSEDGRVETRAFSEDAFLHAIRFMLPKDTVAFVENVHAMPKQGVTSMFSFGRNFGWILGALAVQGVETVLVEPRKWQKRFGISGDKASHIATARELFPDANLFRTDRCKVEHDGIADAILIAEYGRRTKRG